MTAQLAAQLQDALGPDYRIEQELDGGGMSRLFLATDLRHNRRVVVKVLSPELVSTHSAARFKREIELTVRLQHPHILPILTSGSWDDCLYYITPYIAGESLKARIEREGKLPLDDIVKILRDVSGALAFAHQRGIVHRDVKPGNILLAEGHAILADFGIARAVATNATPLTGSGMVPGTPAYMAPELPTDEKADVYALGVVAYEMLTGSLPKRGSSAKDVAASRQSPTSTDSHRVRRLADLIARAISPDIGQRFSSAEEMRVAVEGLSDRPSVGHRGRVVAAAVGVVALTAAVLVAAPRFRGAPLDPSVFAVLAVGPPTDSLNGAVARRIIDGLAEWGITPVEPPVAGGLATVGAALESARSARAGRSIVITTAAVGDSVRVDASLYDVSTARSLRKRTATLSQMAAAGPTRSVRVLVNGLLRDGTELPWPDETSRRIASLAAWRALDSGRGAVAAWDLANAEDQLRAAVRQDSSVTPANLWLAQVLVWRSDRSPPNAELRALLSSAAGGVQTLSTNDRELFGALLAVADRRYPDAQAAFRRMVRADSTSLVGWLGLGDAALFDRVVVRDPRSPSSWAFRSSYQAAAVAYQRAGEVAPATIDARFRGWLLGRLEGVLFPALNLLRSGYAIVGRDTIKFAARAASSGDSTGFVPFEVREVALGRGDPPIAHRLEAAARHRETLRRVAEQWVSRSPESAAAFDSLASLTELSGGLAQVGTTRISALEIVGRARSLSRDSAQQLRLAVAQVRLHLKAENFRQARSLADSILRAAPHDQYERLASLAGLLGRPSIAAELRTRGASTFSVLTASGKVLTPSPPLAEDALRLSVFAAAGVTDSASAALGRMRERIPSYYPAEPDRHAAETALFAAPLSFLFPRDSSELNRLDLANDETIRAQQLFLNGDVSAVNRQMATWRDRTRQGALPGSVAIDATYRRAVLALAMADTAGAIAQLDPVLLGLPTLGLRLLDEPAQATTLVRAMALRASIAAAVHDRATAVRWARTVAELWSGADARLKGEAIRLESFVK